MRVFTKKVECISVRTMLLCRGGHGPMMVCRQSPWQCCRGHQALVLAHPAQLEVGQGLAGLELCHSNVWGDVSGNWDTQMLVSPLQYLVPVHI
jgi:hypothetical protein